MSTGRLPGASVSGRAAAGSADPVLRHQLRRLGRQRLGLRRRAALILGLRQQLAPRSISLSGLSVFISQGSFRLE
jgi:hypothetical protein